MAADTKSFAGGKAAVQKPVSTGETGEVTSAEAEAKTKAANAAKKAKRRF